MTSHLIGVFWILRDFASLATFTPVQVGPNHPMTALVTHPWFNLGPFGVGVFFLISGLVIPFSLERHSAGTFLAARLLRIYPTYMLALLIEVAMLWFNSAYWNRPFLHGAWTVVSNLLLIQDLVGQPSIDLVNWTLCVELRFYVVMALLAGAIRRGSLVAVAGTAAVAFGLIVAAEAGAFGPVAPDPVLLSYAASTESLFIVFMLIGVVFNYHVRGLIGTPVLCLAVAGLGAVFALGWQRSVLAHQYPGVTANYACALALFAVLYALRAHVRGCRVLDGLAAISFPLYLVHSLIGYSVLKLLLLAGRIGYPVALAVAVLAVIAVGALLHRTVEIWTIHAGKSLALAGVRNTTHAAANVTKS